MKHFIKGLMSVFAVLSFCSVSPVFAAEEVPVVRESLIEDTHGLALELASEGTIFTVSEEKNANKTIEADGQGSNNVQAVASRLPDFDNSEAWLESESPYNTPALWGQCTWFAWARFYEIYGYAPGFMNNGWQCAEQLVTAHPDEFVLENEPRTGAVFSCYNHVGIVLDVTEDTITIQDGNLDFMSNPVWEEAIEDWRTITMTKAEFYAQMGETIFANPVGTVIFK